MIILVVSNSCMSIFFGNSFIIITNYLVFKKTLNLKREGFEILSLENTVPNIE